MRPLKKIVAVANQAASSARQVPFWRGPSRRGILPAFKGVPAGAKEPHAVTLTLFNAGGADNGPALGGCTVRYLARPNAKGWTIELSEALDR